MVKRTWEQLVLLIALALALATVLGCAGGTATPTGSPSPTPTPTPSPTKEWTLEHIQQNDSTVTVSLKVFSGIDVWATLDGRRADEVMPDLPTVRHVFRNVTLGKHVVEVRDVVGFKETADVVVPRPSISEWLNRLIQKLSNEPVADPPASVIQYEYKGRTVYYVPPRCCDIFSDLYDADGTLIGHPDGGITGRGDGHIPDFFEERRNETIIWKDPRVHNPRLAQELAPIQSVKILMSESFPVQYSALVVSGLPNSCYSLAGYRLDRTGDTIRIEVTNWKPVDPGIACAQVYGTMETTIPLGSDFELGKTYTILVNDATANFVAR